MSFDCPRELRDSDPANRPDDVLLILALLNRVQAFPGFTSAITGDIGRAFFRNPKAKSRILCLDPGGIPFLRLNSRV